MQEVFPVFFSFCFPWTPGEGWSTASRCLRWRPTKPRPLRQKYRDQKGCESARQTDLVLSILATSTPPMAAKQPIPLHHLPTRDQNIFYILALIACPLINLGLNSLVFTDFRLIALKGTHSFGLFNWVLGLSSLLLGLVVILLGINLEHTLQSRQRKTRKSLLIFGIASSLYLFTNLLTIIYGIFEFKIQSMFLLIVSICVYVSLSITFVFWYWYLDYPSQLRRIHHPESTPEICFPDNMAKEQGWLPSFWDYLYFVILTSNTLGPPENHSPAGRKAKVVVLLHSVVMLIVLVIFISHAINTLD